ncbi:hypothetical protein [Daejeonella oryzae]|uniref:hypothetical protein n=1 Tax=Daejeonella oryzae TaxID=1122943 RepID=UPI000478786D|nr:hypothetical protein [Daejeonella oryzae]
MTKDLIFKPNSIFDSVSFNKDADRWQFNFADNIYVASSGFWRLLESNRIVIVSLDNGHQFGHPQPLDLSVEVNKLLTDKMLTEIRVDNETADLTLTISEGITLQIFIASSGYESYDFSIYDKRYIGLGSGDIGIIEAQENPQILTTRKL